MAVPTHGAGTTAAVVVPPHGPQCQPRGDPVPAAHGDHLAAAIHAAVQDPRYRGAATSLAERIAVEDGADAVVQLVDRTA